MKKIIILSALFAIIFGGCTAKEFNANVDSITGDTTKAFDEGKDTSAQ